LDRSGSQKSGEVVSAQVILRPADPEGSRGAEPVTAATIARHLPSPDAASQVQSWFRAHGFDVGSLVGNSFSITGTNGTFEKTFKVPLRRSQGKGVGGSRSADYELPVSALPSPVRAPVAAVTFTPPPDFGPTDFSK
jgi:hypothetical protein